LEKPWEHWGKLQAGLNAGPNPFPAQTQPPQAFTLMEKAQR